MKKWENAINVESAVGGGGGFEKLLAWETVFSGLLADHDRSMIALTA